MCVCTEMERECVCREIEKECVYVVECVYRESVFI